ncbi:Cytochrome P450 86B1 [Linum grandiflorum]
MAAPYTSSHHTTTIMLLNSTSFSFSPAATATPAIHRILFLREIHFLDLLLAFSVFLAIHSTRQRRLSQRSGLPVWPLLGMLPSLISAAVNTNIYDWMTSVLVRRNGTFLFKGPSLSSLNCVMTSDPGNVEYLLKTNFANFPKGRYFRDNLLDLLGHGIFNADDETWQKQRKTASIEFHSAKFRSLTYSSLFELVHARLLPVLDEVAGGTKYFQNITGPNLQDGPDCRPIDLQDVLLRLTFDNVCMIAFGVDPGCLTPGLPEVSFATAFENATEATMLRFMMPTCVWRAMRWAEVGPERVLKRSIRRVDEFADGVIRARKKELALMEDEEKISSDILTVFMRLRDETGRAYSDKFLRDICVNFILAGRDTSSVALSWFFWLVDAHPEVEERIVKEISMIVKERSSEISSEEVVLKPEEIKRMDYLQAALSEALRLYPSVPVDHKEVVEDDVFPDGTVLKKGTKVIYAIYAMGRMESIWGKDCNDFKPERWLGGKDGRFASESAYKFTAFNGGPRLCLGKDFAYYQMKFVAASIMYRYKVKVVEDHPVEPKLALTMYMKHGLKVNLYRRRNDESASSCEEKKIDG